MRPRALAGDRDVAILAHRLQEEPHLPHLVVLPVGRHRFRQVLPQLGRVLVVLGGDAEAERTRRRRRGPVDAAIDLEGGLLAQDFDAVIVDRVVAMGADRCGHVPEGAAAEPQGGGGGVLVLDVVEEAAGEGGDLGQRLAHQMQVEVAGVAPVVEDRAAALAPPRTAIGVFVVVGHRVVPARVDPPHDDPAQPTRLDCQLGLPGLAEEARAVLHSELDRVAPGRVDHRVGLAQRRRHRPLGEDVPPRLGRGDRGDRVHGRLGGDDHRLQVVVAREPLEVGVDARRRPARRAAVGGQRQ